MIPISEETYANHALELRRGTIVLAVLSMLKEPYYGYGLLQALEAADVPVDAGTLYPLLRRLEGQGILSSAWDTSEARPRKFYQLSTQGYVFYKRLHGEWDKTQKKLQTMLNKGEENGNN